MKKISTIFLQAVTVLIGIGVLIFMLWEPHLEGRNVDSTLFEIYFKDPFLAYVYMASIPFFIALYQAFKALGYARRDRALSQEVANSLRIIKYCALVTAGFIAGAEAYLFVVMRSKDDIAGAAMLGFVAAFASVIITATAATLESILQSTLNKKLGSD
jgi:hypothetical protein